jgi:hypothetical protein
LDFERWGWDFEFGRVRRRCFWKCSCQLQIIVFRQSNSTTREPFEQNKKYKGKFKFYFADLLYKPKLIINEKTRNNPPAKTQHPTYNEKVEEILINVFSQNHLDEKYCKKTLNGSTSLSFCSFSSDYKFKNSNEIEQKFKDEILHLISRIKDKPLEEHIQLLSK